MTPEELAAHFEARAAELQAQIGAVEDPATRELLQRTLYGASPGAAAHACGAFLASLPPAVRGVLPAPYVAALWPYGHGGGDRDGGGGEPFGGEGMEYRAWLTRHALGSEGYAAIWRAERTAWIEVDPERAESEAARRVLLLASKGEPGPAVYTAVLAELAGRGAEGPSPRVAKGMAEELAELVKRAAELFTRSDASGADGPLSRDLDLADLLPGPCGDTVREKAGERWIEAHNPARPLPGMPTRGEPGTGTRWDVVWDLWLSGRWLSVLTGWLWETRWERGATFAAAKHAPGIPGLLRSELRNVANGVTLLAASTGGVEYRARDGSPVARFSGPTLTAATWEAMKAGIPHMRGLLFERVVRGLVRGVWEQAACGGSPFDPLVWEGGFEGFADAHGIKDNNARAKLPALFEAMQNYRGGRRDIPPLLQFWVSPASGRNGGRAELRVQIGEALAPGYVSKVALMPGTARGDTWLIPCLPLPALTLPGAVPGDAAALCDLQWELLRMFRERAEELAAFGGIQLSAADLQGACKRSKVRSGLACVVRSAWTTGPDAWLRELQGDRIALVDAGAMALLAEGAAYTATASARGLRSVAKRTKCR
jgi:hypothetical protein